MADRYVRSEEFAEKMGWKKATVWRKLLTSRTKVRDGKPLTRTDIPIPHDDTKKAPRWLLSQLEEFKESYQPRPGESVPPS